MEDVDFRSWISEWQVVVGFVLYLNWFFVIVCIILPMQGFFGWLCFGSRRYFQKPHLRRETSSLLLLLTSASKFLMIYGTLKHSAALAVLLIMVQSFFSASAHAIDHVLFENSKIRKLKQHLEKKQATLEKLHDNIKDAKEIIQKAHGRMSQVPVPVSTEESEIDDNGLLEPVSAYSDFEGCGVLECTLVFAVQMMLYAVLIASIFTRDKFIPGEEHTENEYEYMKFVAGAVVATLMAIRGESFGKNELWPFWYHYFTKKEYRKKWHWWRVRVLMSWLVNAFFSRVMVLMLPIILMDSDDGVEFVKDATCVLFIAELDMVNQASKPLLPEDEENEVPENDPPGPENEENEVRKNDLPGFVQVVPVNVEETSREDDSRNEEGDSALLAPLPGDLPLPDFHAPDPMCKKELHDNTPILE